MNENIQELLKDMYKYQKINNINGDCFVNCVILYDFICSELKEQDCKIVCGYINKIIGNDSRIVVHCWVELFGNIIDPSYEFYNQGYRYINHIYQFNNIPQDTKRFLLTNKIDFDKDIKLVITNSHATPDEYEKFWEWRIN